MSDKTMEDIKSGKGLPPLSNNDCSSNQSGITKEQRGTGITYGTFSRKAYDKSNNSTDND